jgi:glycerophosphoryl diester phosphodiesterase
MVNRVIYSSFDHYSLVKLKKLNPDAKIGLLYSNALVDPWVYANYISANAIHPHYAIIQALPETVAKCHENGVLVNVWTINNADILKYMFECGVDAVITDRPDLAPECRENYRISP